MIIKNKFENPFGPFGSSAGLFLLITGLIVAYKFYLIPGIILALVGGFAGFTTTSTIIDTEKKRIKSSNNLFGIITTGKWIDIKPGMKIGLKNTHRGYRGYSRTNVSYSLHNYDIRIILYGSDNKKIMPIKKFNSLDSAKEELKELSNLLGLDII